MVTGRLDIGFERSVDQALLPSEVNSKGAHPLYKWLKAEKGGVLGSAIKWNFSKFLVDPQGRVVERFAPTTKPEALAAQVEAILPA
jgi:glutathione peroxidase